MWIVETCVLESLLRLLLFRERRAKGAHYCPCREKRRPLFLSLSDFFLLLKTQDVSFVLSLSVLEFSKLRGSTFHRNLSQQLSSVGCQAVVAQRWAIAWVSHRLEDSPTSGGPVECHGRKVLRWSYWQLLLSTAEGKVEGARAGVGA